MALSTNASSYALSNYTSSTSSSKSTNASSNALSNYTSSTSSSSSSKSTSTSVTASSNALSNYTSSSSSSSSAVNKTISAEAWNASATPSSPTPNASSNALSNYTSTTSSSAPAKSSSASSSATPNASSNALSNYTSTAVASQASPTPNASSNALSSYLNVAASKGQDSAAAKAANFAVPAVIAGTSGAAAEASGIDLLAAFTRSLGGSFAGLGALAAGFVLLSTSPAGAGEDKLVHQLGLGNVSPATKKAEKGEQPETASTDAPAKVVPNPYGKKGGPAHQAGVSSAVDELRKKYEAESEVTVTTEVRVVTPGGRKNSRFLDAAAVGGDGAVVEGLQVGRTNKTTDEPVSRERKAMQDVQAAIQDALIGFRKIRGK